jgi:hypothetical protein
MGRQPERYILIFLRMLEKPAYIRQIDSGYQGLRNSLGGKVSLNQEPAYR